MDDRIEIGGRAITLAPPLEAHIAQWRVYDPKTDSFEYFDTQIEAAFWIGRQVGFETALMVHNLEAP
jgi:hypothetical protein